jgi:hypothetical protein
MAQYAMPEKKNGESIPPITVWPEYWHKRFNTRLHMRVENINNLLIIYEISIMDELNMERKLNQNFV